MKSYQVALQFDPNAALPHAMLGKGLIRAGQREKGLQMLERAVELDADNAELITDLAIGYAMMGRDREAIARLAALTDQRPELSSPHFHLARLYRQQRQYSDAIRELETYLRAEPTSSDAIYQLAWLLAAAPDEADRNPQRAREWFERLPKSFPRDSLEYHDLDALLLAAAGDFDAAVRRTDEGLRRADAAATPATTPAPASVAAEEPPAAPRPPRTAADYLRARRELYARRQPYREPARGKSPAGAPGKPR
jgi:tetratricopeptide (TPR) repeat protein